MIVRENLVVGYCELIPVESEDELSAPQDIATERVSEKKQNNYFWTEENWPILNKYLVNSRYLSLRGQCDAVFLELGLDPVPKQTVSNILQRIDKNSITYENDFTMKKRALLSENQLNYVEDIIVKKNTSNIGMSRKEVIQFIS